MPGLILFILCKFLNDSDGYFLAVLFLCELHDSSIREPTEEGLCLFIGCKFDGGDFYFLGFFVDLFVGWGFLIDSWGWESERL